MTDFIANMDNTIIIAHDIDKLAEVARTKLGLIAIEIQMLKDKQEAIEDLDDYWWEIDMRIDDLMEEQMNVEETFNYIKEMQTKPAKEYFE